MSDKTQKRMRRCRALRARIHRSGAIRLTVHRTSRHMYAQLIDADNHVLAAASTVDKAIRDECPGYLGNVAAAEIVGKIIAQRGTALGIAKIAFDRSGFLYHGRVKALAEAARKHGLKF